MQTFLPYRSMSKSIRCLDYRRLGKQRVEALQILNALGGKSKGWVNHPATKMWRGYESALKFYKDLCIEEWVRRGYKNTMERNTTHGPVLMPHWLGDEKLHASHRSNLLRKDPVFYGNLNWNEPDNLPYHWPAEEPK
tara:strand:+ start:150 stop:560 length:411 start_codon:yes stop_codon:yes gene_type:complete